MKKVILMLAVAAMASCSKSELTERPIASDVELKAASSVLSVETKAPYLNTLANAGETLEAYVVASLEQGKYLSTDNTTWWNGDVMNFGSGTNVSDAVGFDTPKYYPADAATNVYLFGLVPETVADWTFDTTNGAYATCAIDGKTDIMIAPTQETKKADLQGSSPKGYPKMVFKHLLTLINLQVYAEELTATDGSKTYPAIDAWGKITKIELLGVNESGKISDGVNDVCKVTFYDATVTDADKSKSEFSAATTATAMEFYTYNATAAAGSEYEDTKISEGSGYELTKDKTLMAYAIVAPFTTADDPNNSNLKLKVYTENNTDGKEVEVKVLQKYDDASSSWKNYLDKSTQGYKFDVTLQFNASEMKASAEVKDWLVLAPKDDTIVE